MRISGGNSCNGNEVDAGEIGCNGVAAGGNSSLSETELCNRRCMVIKMCEGMFSRKSPWEESANV